MSTHTDPVASAQPHELGTLLIGGTRACVLTLSASWLAWNLTAFSAR